MERFALLLVSGRGVPCKDHKRAVQLMHHALSHISSGQSKVRGVHALLKQLVLSYRIMFVRLCDFIIGRLSFSTVRYAVARITNRIRLLSTPDRIYPVESLKGPKGNAGVVLEGQNGAEAGTINESDRFLKSAITFPTIRYLSEESSSVAVPGNINTDEGEAYKIETITSEKRIKGQGQGEGLGQGQGQGQGQKITAVKTGEDDWSKWRRLGRKVDVKESISEPVTGIEQSSQSHYAKSKLHSHFLITHFRTSQQFVNHLSVACMYLSMYVCMNVCMYVYMVGFMCVHVYGCMYVNMYIWMDGCMYVCAYVCSRLSLSTLHPPRP